MKRSIAITLVLLAAVLTLTGCSSSQKPPGERPYSTRWCPAGSECSRSVTGILPAGPGASVEDAAWNQAVSEAGAKLAADPHSRKPMRTVRPRIRYLSCNFIVANPAPIPGVEWRTNECAAGKTTSDGKEIWVSVEDPGRVKALLVWEFKNSLYIRNGRGGWAY